MKRTIKQRQLRELQITNGYRDCGVIGRVLFILTILALLVMATGRGLHL